MANAELVHTRGEVPLPELVPLRQCLTELELAADVRQTVKKALAPREELLRQRLDHLARHAERSALLGQMAAKMVHDIRNPLNAIFLHADVVEEELQRPTPDSRHKWLHLWRTSEWKSPACMILSRIIWPWHV